MNDLTGHKFHLLTAISAQSQTSRGAWVWKFLCDCGRETTARGDLVRAGSIKSCGCYRRTFRRKHGHNRFKGPRSREYRSWQMMKNRCLNPKATQFKYYGGRGIRVCARWSKFENFLADMGDRPAGKTLDRIDNDGNYEPGNCRWATSVEQRRNRRDFVGPKI